MNLIALFTTFRGRINRKQWWIGFLILMVLEIALIAAVDPGYFAVPHESAGEVPPPTTPNVWNMLVVLAFCVPALAITVKRFNDRNYVWWIGYAVFVPSLVYYIGPAFGLFVTDPEHFTVLEHVLFWPMALLGLFVLVDNGFMRGTKGPNDYGPDPNTDVEFDAA